MSKKTTKSTELTTPSVLAFERKLDLSDAIFFQQNGDDQTTLSPVVVREKSVRGTISNRLKGANALKLDTDVEKANLQKIDIATLDDDKDTLIAQFSCKVLPFDGKPNVCNNMNYQQKVLEVVETYLTTLGITELAHRYATNLVNGRWLWRNRMNAQDICIEIKCGKNCLRFDNVKQLSLNDFSSQNDEIRQVAKWIEQGLKGETFVILSVTAWLKMGYGQEVYPSQELVLETNKEKSKILYSINGKAAMHSQKIGNAIRTIDTWYQAEAPFPIAIEPYGAVTTLGTAFRQPSDKLDFYTLFDNWLLKDNLPSVEQQHYVMSVLIRGGVFGESGKEK